MNKSAWEINIFKKYFNDAVKELTLWDQYEKSKLKDLVESFAPTGTFGFVITEMNEKL